MDTTAKENHHTITARLNDIHRDLQGWLPAVKRLAVALYDAETDVLKTFVNSTEEGSPLDHYQAKLSDVRSLQQLARSRQPRTINDLSMLSAGDSAHSQKIIEKGYLSSHTVPIVHNDTFHGFVFFDADERDYFTDAAVHKIDIYAQLVGLLCVTEFNAIHTLQAAVKTAREISQFRDEETGFHLIRMANFSRLIALDLADRHGLSDEYIEFLFYFAPLHDIGKIAIPDTILLKPGRFSEDELAVMRQHVSKGGEIVDKLISGFHMEHMPKIDMLRNIVLYHHEAMDGSGYPNRLEGAAIPLEARIVSVADVFDALTSDRPYKKAWDNDEAFAYLQDKTDTVFDAECVAALCRQRTDIEEIQKRFQESYFG